MNQWQPIETAPKDGTMIDLWVDGDYPQRYSDAHWGKGGHECGEMGEYCDSDWHSQEEGWTCSFGMPIPENKVTHWLPLPPPPTEQSSAPAKGEFGEPWEVEEYNCKTSICDKDGNECAIFESDKDADRAIACANLLAGHDLTKVAVVALSVIEAADRTLRNALSTLDYHSAEGCKSSEDRCKEIESVLAKLKPKPDAGKLQSREADVHVPLGVRVPVELLAELTGFVDDCRVLPMDDQRGRRKMLHVQADALWTKLQNLNAGGVHA